MTTGMIEFMVCSLINDDAAVDWPRLRKDVTGIVADMSLTPAHVVEFWRTHMIDAYAASLRAPYVPADDATVPATPAEQLTRREAAGVHRSGLSRMGGTVQRVEYAHGIVVTFERIPVDGWHYSEDQRWYYGVWTEHGAECEESGYAATRAEATEYARTARESLSYRH